MFFLFLIYLASNFQYAENVVCTRNKDYARGVSSSVEIYLCKNTDCKTDNVQYLESDMTYFGCVKKTGESADTKREVRLKIIRKLMRGNEPRLCYNINTWEVIQASQPCPPMKDFIFKPGPGLNSYDIYIVTCDDVEDEFPNGDAPRIQIFGYDTEVPVKEKYVPVLFPTQTILCMANCKEATPTFTSVSGGTYLTLKDNSFVIKVTDISIDNDIAEINIDCSITNSRLNLTFNIANNITGKIMSQTGGRLRQPEVYDAGEMVSCLVSGSSTRTKTYGSPPQSFISIVGLDNSNAIRTYYTVTNSSQLEIPEGLLPSETYHYYCFLGNISTRNVFQVVLDRISIGSRFVTKLASNYPTYEFDFPKDAKISCDVDAYKKLTTPLNFATSSISTSLYIIYAKNTTYPMSYLQNYVERQWDNASSGEMVFSRKFQYLQMYVFCTVNLYPTTPRPIYAGDRPKVSIVYIHPRWQTEYYLRGFKLQCLGEHITDIDFTCLDCLPDMRLNVRKEDFTSVNLSVPYTLRKNIKVKYRCTGYSNRYDAVSITLDMNIIVSEYTDFDSKNLFYIYQGSSISCVSQFNVIVDNAAVKKQIILPLQLQIDGGRVLNIDGEQKSVSLSYSGSNVIVNFQACCPPFSQDAYSCLGRWKIVKVARNFKVKFNLPVDEIFPGNLLKCFVCVNYTFHTSNMPCIGENKINSLISMTVIYPDGREEVSVDQDSVHSPVEGLKPDGEGYYKITDYNVKIGCKSLGEVQLFEVKMKSCNLNPPKIQISPPDKTMYLVGDIFSCTTEAVNCKNGLAYTIYVQRGNDPAEKRDSHSFTLTLRHIGNNILIKCAAGEGETSIETRLIRVEASPYNVSIQNLNKMMVYGNYFRCNALGFPPPAITWTQLKGSSVLRISESFLLIGPWDFPGDYIIQCEAKNKRGSVTTSASFKVFNPRIVYSDYSVTFYFFVPFLTFVYLCLLIGSILVIFQENFFGVPFFSGGGKDVKSKSKEKPAPIVPMQSTKESIITTNVDATVIS